MVVWGVGKEGVWFICTQMFSASLGLLLIYNYTSRGNREMGEEEKSESRE